MPKMAQGENMKKISVMVYVMLALSILLLSSCNKAKPEVEEPIPEVSVLAQDLLANMIQIDTAIATHIEAWEGKITSQEDIRVLLAEAQKAHPAVLTSCYVDTKGILKYLEPAAYKDSEGADISKQAHTIAMLQNPTPMISTAFKAVEGFATVAMGRPLYDAKEKFAGSLVLTIDTSRLPQAVLQKNEVASGYELWAMEPDGMIVCDHDKDEIGLNLFTDPMYLEHESLQNFGKLVIASPKGEGEYRFKAAGSEEVVTKKAYWDTINIHGRDWRVVLAQKG